ncbi:MAG TPA: alpha/beta hydrolase [Xanthobacteraceae bacterium]|nr:alpha/beta hydrolase [Xanthobacteraceae bacterium]
MAPVNHILIDGRRVAYREAGNGPAIFFLHGLGGNSASWEPQFTAFSTRYRTVAWDMPGFGNSEVLQTRPATTRDYSRLAQRLMDALAIDRAHVVGTSYGTVIVADLARSNPRRVASIIFACGVTGMGHLDPQERARLRSVRRSEIESMGQRKFAELRNSTYVAKGLSAELVKRVVDLAGSADPEGYLQAYGALTESNIFPLLADIDVPALVVSGANDPIAPAKDCERVARALAKADYHCIQNSGHYVNLEQTAVFNRLLEDFLARVAQPARKSLG